VILVRKDSEDFQVHQADQDKKETKVQAVKEDQKVQPVLSVHSVQWVKREKKVPAVVPVIKENEVLAVHQVHPVLQVLQLPSKDSIQNCSSLLENDEQLTMITSVATLMTLTISSLFQTTLKVSKKCSPL
jgi:hypothetical protein